MRRAWALAVLLALAPLSLAAQSGQANDTGRWSLALQDVAVDEALTRLVSLTGIDLVYASEVTRGRRTFCRASEVDAETLLRCIVEGAELDFYRLSSGTYVVIDDPRDAPAYGTVVGVVVDAGSGRPVPYAAVEDPASGRRTVSDAQGRFLLPGLLPGESELVASGMGYRPTRTRLGVTGAGAVRHRIHLHPEAVRMAPLVVRGMEPRLSRGELGEAVVVAPGGEAPTTMGRGPMASTGKRPGISRDPFSADLRIQGGSVGEHLVRLDGIPVFEPVSLGRMLSAFSPLALERVTVRKAGFGVEHGSFVGGVVDVEQGAPGAPQAGAALRADPYAAGARLTLPLPGAGGEEGRLLGAVRSSVWGVWREPVLDGVLRDWNAVDPVLMRNLAPGTGGVFGDALDWQPHRHGSELSFNDVHLRAELPVGDFRRVEASFYRGDNRVGTDLFAAGVHPETGLPDRLMLSRDDYDWGNTAGQLSWSALAGDRGSLRLRLRGSSHELDHRYAMVDASGLQAPGGGPAPTDVLEGLLGAALDSVPVASDGNAITEVGAEVTGRWAASRTHVLSGGLEAARVDSRVHLDDPWFQRLSSSHRQERVAAFVQDRWTPTERLSTEVGFRATRLTDRGATYLEPRAALRLDLPSLAGGSLSLRGSWGVHRQFLNRFEVTSVGPSALVPAVQFWAPPDPTVEPARAEHTGLEAAWRSPAGFEVRVEGWHKELTHLLDLDYGALLLHDGAALREVEQADFIAAARGRATGASVRVAYDAGLWRGQLGYDHTRSRRTFPSRFGGELQPVPWLEPHRLTAAGEVGLGGGFTVRAEFLGVWGRPWGLRRPYYDYLTVHGTGGGPVVGRPGDDRLPPLLETDLGLGWARRLGGSWVEVQALVRNVLDRDNVLDRSLVLEPGGGYGSLPRFLPGINPLLTVRISP